MTEADVRVALHEVIDPELGINIVDLGLVRAIDVDGANLRVSMIMTTPACPLRDYLQDLVESTVASRLPGVQDVVVDIAEEPAWTADMMSEAARRQLE